MLESTYYAVSIATMSVFLLLGVAILVGILRARRNARRFKENFVNKITGIFKERNVEIVSALGLTLVHFVMDRMKKRKSRA